NPDKFDLSTTYSLPLKIESAEGVTISGNFGKAVLQFGAKNQFDGIYTVTGSVVDANGLYKGIYPTEIALITLNANAVVTYNSEIDYPNFLVESIASGGLANTGIRPAFVINGETGEVTRVYNFATGLDMAKGTCKYNPSDGSIDIEW